MSKFFKLATAERDSFPSSIPPFFTHPTGPFVPNLELIYAHNQLSRKLKKQKHFPLTVCCLLWWWQVRMDIKQRALSVGASHAWHPLACLYYKLAPCPPIHN